MSRVLRFMVPFLGACAASPDAASVAQELGGPPWLSAEPAWSAAGPPGSGGCFGASVAVADLDGDGQRDLIVAEPNCPWELVTQGRIAIYPGDGDAFADTPVLTSLAWLNPPRGGTSMRVSTGDVDGDGRADLLVAARGGAQVFAGITSVAAPLGAPTWRVPAVGTFGVSVLADLEGDSRAEIISVRAGAATVWRASGAALVSARVIAPAISVQAAGDTNGDGRDDVIVTRAGHSDLFHGCALTAADCTGGLGTAPAWGRDQTVAGMVPDLDGDGLGEALLGDSGRVWLHLSDPLTGLEPTAVWSSLADPNYPVLGGNVIRPGDLDGDHQRTEFLVTAAGRVYAFFPRPNHLDELDPGFAWPRANLIQDQLLDGELFVHASLSVAAAGKVDGDKYADLVFGSIPDFDAVEPGRVYLMRGGKLPPAPHTSAPPFLPGELTCALPTGDLPDLWVDPDTLARTTYVEYRDFAPDACELAEACVGGPGTRKLLRFATSIVNLGAAPYVIPGPETAPELYHFDECHGHDHLADFAGYRLLDGGGEPVATGHKQGFFLVDIAPYCSNGAPRVDLLPDQGISPGWSDVYVASIPCQWIDITGVPDGIYTLEVAADTQHLIEQADVLSDTASITVQISADRATVLP